MNKNGLDIFCELPCLLEKSPSLNGVNLSKKWFKNIDKRKISEYLLKFISYNQEYFDFLGIIPSISGFDQNSSIFFRTTNFVGTIPLRAPDTGKQIGDFVVTPRFWGNDRYAEYINILNLLEKKIAYETICSLPLISGRLFHPPLYYEACKFVDSLFELIQIPWNKFAVSLLKSKTPIGQIDWDAYGNSEYKAENKLIYPTRLNTLNENHEEYACIKYVFDLCKKELTSINTPTNIKLSYKNKIQVISENLELIRPIQTNKIPIHFSDNFRVKVCKLQANKILDSNLQIGIAWRVDFSEVFERYVQYLFNKVSKEIGGRLLVNPKISRSDHYNFSWTQKYLEPDAIFQKNNILIMIDAKYKSHLYNKWEESEYLRQEHRNDLHQILCYSSFNSYPQKFCFLCYPASELDVYPLRYQNSGNKTSNIIYLLGVPVELKDAQKTIQLIMQTVSEIEKEIFT